MSSKVYNMLIMVIMISLLVFVMCKSVRDGDNEPVSITSETTQTEPVTESPTETEPQYTEPDVWAERYAEYPVATEVWLTMKEFGWSDVVCAGIMGNLMRETGGDTLNLKPKSNSSSGFGLVQWTGQRKKDMFNKYGHSPTIAEQVEFMKDELFGSNGVRKQVTDQQRKRIFEASTPGKCAAEFARWFERPASKNYSKREANARKAYYYFQ